MAYTKEERQEYDHHYYLAHREKRLAQIKVWREANKEHVSEYSHKRYLMNREKKLAYQKEHRRKKKEKEKMENEKVISRTRTFQILDETGRLVLIKMTLEMVDPMTKERLSLPKDTLDLRNAMTRAAYEAAIALAEEQRNDSKASS